MAHLAYVGVGANLGDPAAQVRAALVALEKLGRVQPSSLYRSEPIGDPTQPWYVNAVCRLWTPLPPEPLLDELQRIEQAAGRPRRRRSGASRVLDLDILLYDELFLATPRLRIPHPRMHLRRFVLEPLVEIAADVLHPGEGRSARELLRSLDEPSRVERLSPSRRAADRPRRAAEPPAPGRGG